MRSMALKLNISRDDQAALNDMLKSVECERQKRKFHCTVGFIEKMIPEEESIDFGEKMTQLLQEHIDPLSLTYEVREVEHLFGHVIAFLPTAPSSAHLKGVNEWLERTVDQVSEGRWRLNEATTGQSYIPHMTLWRSRHIDARFKKLKKVVENHPSFRLMEAAYVDLP